MVRESEKFQALVVEKGTDQQISRTIKERSLDALPPGELLVRVLYSSLNYKDALAATGHPGVTRHFPHTPGVDAAGTVISSASPAFAPGDAVIVTGFDLGMGTPGGWGEYIRIPAAWAVPLPAGLTLRAAMALGTAGFTAALALLKLASAGVAPGDGEILVTGASGGVGSLSVALLSQAGYRVVAASGKGANAEFLHRLGAVEIISRQSLREGGERPLLKERWAGVVDVVGGEILAAAIKATRYGGSVTCCGLVASPDLPLNVYPFILRGVSLLGIDSVQAPGEQRRQVWQLLAKAWKEEGLAEMVTEIPLAGLEEKISAILHGEVRGRVVVKL